MGLAKDKHGVRESFAKVTFLFAKNGRSRIKEFWSKPTYITLYYTLLNHLNTETRYWALPSIKSDWPRPGLINRLTRVRGCFSKLRLFLKQVKAPVYKKPRHRCPFPTFWSFLILLDCLVRRWGANCRLEKIMANNDVFNRRFSLQQTSLMNFCWLMSILLIAILSRNIP